MARIGMRLATWVLAKQLVKTAYKGILNRPADEAGISSYSAQLRANGNLARILANLNLSEENWKRQLSEQSASLVTSVYQGLLERAPEPEALKSYAKTLSESQDIAELIAAISSSLEHWHINLSRQAPTLVQAIYQGLLKRDADAEALERYAIQLAETGDLAPILSEIGYSQEQWRHALAQQAPTLVQAIFQGLLKRDADAETLESYASQLAKTGDLAPILSEIGYSQEQWRHALANKAPSLVQAIYQGLLKRDAEAEALENYAQKLAETGDLAHILREVGYSQEHWKNALAQHASALVNSLYQGLLGRAPSPEELDRHCSSFSANPDISTLVSEIQDASRKYAVPAAIERINCDNKQKEAIKAKLNATASLEELVYEAIHVNQAQPRNFINQHAEELIDIAYQGILGRAADAAGLAHHSQVLKRTGDLTACLRTLLNSTEFEENQLQSQKGLAVSALQTLIEPDQPAISALQSAGDIKTFHESMIQAAAPALRNKLSYQKASPNLSFSSAAFPRLEAPRDFCLIFVPLEIWLPFGLAMADHMRATKGYESVFVWEQWNPAVAEAVSLSPNVYEVIGINELRKLPTQSRFSPKAIITHSFGWEWLAKFMLERFPESELMVYADGFKNAVEDKLNSIRKISNSFFFGYRPENSPPLDYVILDAKNVNDYSDKAAEVYALTAEPREAPSSRKCAAVYLRYWGTGPYAFSLEYTAQLMANTVASSVSKDTFLVIKNDKRAKKELLKMLQGELESRGFEFCELGEYLESNGVSAGSQDLPVEYFFGKGLLTEMDSHIVFDSGLSYIIASSQHIAPKARISIGADLSAFNQSSLLADGQSASAASTPEDQKRLASIEKSIEGIIHFARHYSHAVSTVPDWQLEENIENTLFIYQKSGSNHLSQQGG